MMKGEGKAHTIALHHKVTFHNLPLSQPAILSWLVGLCLARFLLGYNFSLGFGEPSGGFVCFII